MQTSALTAQSKKRIQPQNPLSTGQILGITAGSVAGAGLLGLAGFVAARNLRSDGTEIFRTQVENITTELPTQKFELERYGQATESSRHFIAEWLDRQK